MIEHLYILYTYLVAPKNATDVDTPAYIEKGSNMHIITLQFKLILISRKGKMLLEIYIITEKYEIKKIYFE